MFDNQPVYDGFMIFSASPACATTTTSYSPPWPPEIVVIRTRKSRPEPHEKVWRIEDTKARHNGEWLAIVAKREAKNTRPRERAPPVWALKAARRRRPAGAMIGQRAHRACHRGDSAAPRFSGEDAAP